MSLRSSEWISTVLIGLMMAMLAFSILVMKKQRKLLDASLEIMLKQEDATDRLFNDWMKADSDLRECQMERDTIYSTEPALAILESF